MNSVHSLIRQRRSQSPTLPETPTQLPRCQHGSKILDHPHDAKSRVAQLPPSRGVNFLLAIDGPTFTRTQKFPPQPSFIGAFPPYRTLARQQKSPRTSRVSGFMKSKGDCHLTASAATMNPRAVSKRISPALTAPIVHFAADSRSSPLPIYSDQATVAVTT
jgi:hypothetical protein